MSISFKLTKSIKFEESTMIFGFGESGGIIEELLTMVSVFSAGIVFSALVVLVS